MRRAALVTGANRGIGLAIASGLVDAGLEVILAARDPAAAAEAARPLGARHVQLDVRDPESIAAAVDACGDVDVLVSNAGVLRAGRLLDNPTVSSGWGSFAEGIGGPSGYGVAKAALNALTVAVAQELPATVLVNAMCPGWVRTRMGGGVRRVPGCDGRGPVPADPGARPRDVPPRLRQDRQRRVRRGPRSRGRTLRSG